MAEELRILKKRFSEEQIAFALRQTEVETAMAEIIRKPGVSEQILDRWKQKYAERLSRQSSPNAWTRWSC